MEKLARTERADRRADDAAGADGGAEAELGVGERFEALDARDELGVQHLDDARRVDGEIVDQDLAVEARDDIERSSERRRSSSLMPVARRPSASETSGPS